MIEDQAEHRVSSCPVHFIWDGLGRGRMWVRWGFFGLIFALATLVLGRWIHVATLEQAGSVFAGVACGIYLIGQALSGVVRLQLRRT
jgi:hypothetical protein